MRLLNVGGGSKNIPLPKIYDGCEHVMLDIDPKSGADIICDARELINLEAGAFDTVFCSHNLEHYYRHHLPAVLGGIKHVMKDGGFAHVSVPNMQYVCEHIAKGGDIEDVLYQSPAGPIRAVDMMYGLGAYIEHTGNDFMCHKNGFTRKSLGNALLAVFPFVFVGSHETELFAFAFKTKPSDQQMLDLKLVNPSGGAEANGAPPSPQPDSASAGD